MVKYVYKKRGLTILFSIIDWFLKWLPKRKVVNKNYYSKILIVNFGHIGDAILLSPFLSILKSRFEKAEIDVLTNPYSENVFKRIKSVNRVISFLPFWGNQKRKKGDFFKSFISFFILIQTLKKRKYDLSFDTKGDPLVILLLFLARIKRRIGYDHGGLGNFLTDVPVLNEKQHQILIYLDLLEPLGIEIEKENIKLNWPLLSEERQWANNFLFRKGVRKNDVLIIIHPGSRDSSRMWPVVYWHKLIKELLNSAPVKIILVVGKGEENLIKQITKGINDSNVIQVINPNLSDLAALIAWAKIFIGVNSGPGHLAAALNIPVVSIFSAANDPVRWRPFTKKLHLFYCSLPCKNCQKKSCKELTCLKLIKPHKVASVILEALKFS